MSTRIIGVHSGHDASACLLVDNVLVGAIAKERLTRKKHDHGDPTECVEYLLKHFGLAPADIDLVIRSNWHDAKDLNHAWYDRFPRVHQTQRHHLLHAYAASVMAPPRPALILICDGRGCRPEDNGDIYGNSDHFEVESVYLHKSGRLIELDKRYRRYISQRYTWGSHIDSLGYAYAAVSKKIFGSSFAAGKVMALAALASHKHQIPPALLFGPQQVFTVNVEWLSYLEQCPSQIDWSSFLAADLAYSIQSGLEAYLVWRTHCLVHKYKYNDLLLGGGVALNCKSNGLLANLPWINSIDIFPAAGDDGLSVGAAIMALREVFGNYQPIIYQVSQGASKESDRSHLVIERAAFKIAQLLTEGKTVGVYQGGSEFGPRALGYRSILSPATNIHFKKKLNKDIKCRESFRPFGGVVLRNDLKKLTSDILASPHMLSAAKVSAEVRDKYPALIHDDGSVRLQVIEQDDRLLSQILIHYKQLSGNVALINTSFNGSNEPIVETLVQARDCATAIGLDYIYAEGHVEKIHV